MALLVHSVLCTFDPEGIAAQFSICWFPFSMVELKEFKTIALRVQQELLEEKRVRILILTSIDWRGTSD